MEYMTNKEEIKKEKIKKEKLKNKYEDVLKENNEIKEEIKKEKLSHEQTKKILEIRISNIAELNQQQERKNEELKEEKQSHEQMREKYKILEQRKEELSKQIDEEKSTNNKLKELNSKFETQIKEYEKVNKNKETEILELQNLIYKQKQELMRMKEELDRCKQTHDIFVCGCDDYNQLGEKPNSKSKDGRFPIISPPMKLSFDPSSYLSYPIYCDHSVYVTNDHSLKGIGNNEDCIITSSLEKTKIENLTCFCMKDDSGSQLNPLSAVCCRWGTLYMFSKNGNRGRQLVLCDTYINKGDPVFLDIGNHRPVALFGGYDYSASICSEGEIIFINHFSIKNSPKSPIASVSLPDGEKASSIACGENSIVALSLNGRVFSSPVQKGSNILQFSEVAEMKGKEIICISGTSHHFLAVSKEGLVFGRGSNDNGKLGLGKSVNNSSSFIEISSLSEYKIRAAYAGYGHSLFETREGKILSCGHNNNGELLLSSGPSEDVYSPKETMITYNATFCIAGDLLSVVFINNNPPPYTPNIRIQQYE